MPRCKSCTHEIIWAETESGKRIPLDAAPASDGNLMLVVERIRGERRLIAKMWTQALFDEYEPAAYVSHFATCPDADKHRRRS
jgi:hypothetical protein